MSTPSNLQSLHAHEEALRAQSLEAIKNDKRLQDHWSIIEDAMNVAFAFSHDHSNADDDELTLQYLGVRLFNAAGTSIKLALAGYYQKAFDQVRDIIETGFLLDYLQTYPDKIAAWKNADKRQRISEFGPGAIRTALDKRDNYTSGERKRIYDLLSEKASHASYGGFILVASGEHNLVQVGPFFDEKKLRVWLTEMAMRLPHAALHLTADPKGVDWPLMAARAQFLDNMNKWRATYLAGSSTPEVEKAPE